MIYPGEKEEIRSMRSQRTLAVGISLAALAVLGFCSLKIKYQNSQLKKNAETIIALQQENFNLKNDLDLMKARNESLEATLFVTEYRICYNELTKKAKKSAKTRKFLDYLGGLEKEVSQSQYVTPESFNIEFKRKILDAYIKDAYFRENSNLLTPSLLGKFSEVYKQESAPSAPPARP